MKYAAVDQYVYEDFLACKAQRLVMHDRDLIETAYVAAEKFGIPNFQVNFSIAFIEQTYQYCFRLALRGYSGLKVSIA